MATGEGSRPQPEGQAGGQDWAEMARQEALRRAKQELTGEAVDKLDEIDDPEGVVDMPAAQWEQASGIPGLSKWQEQLYELRGFLDYESSEGKAFDSAGAAVSENLADTIRGRNKKMLRVLGAAFPRIPGETTQDYARRLMAETEDDSRLITPAELADGVKNRTERGFYDNLVKNTPKMENESAEDYAKRISYLAEVSRRRVAEPNQAGEDDSSWRARIGLPDMETWLRQEAAREEARGIEAAAQEEIDTLTKEASKYTSEDARAEQATKIDAKLREMMPKMLGETPDMYEKRLANALAQVRSISELTFAASDIRESTGAKRKKYNALRKVTEKYPQLEGESLQQYRDRLCYLVLEDGVDLAAIDAEAVEENNESGENDPEALKRAREAAKERAENEPDFKAWLELIGVTIIVIEGLSIDEINRLFEDFENRNTDEGKEKAKKIVLEEFERRLEDEEFKKWLQENGYDVDAIKGMSAEEIRAIIAKYEAYVKAKNGEDNDEDNGEGNGEDGGEGNEDGEAGKEKLERLRKQLVERLKNDPDFAEWVQKEKGIDIVRAMALTAEEIEQLIAEYDALQGGGEDGGDGESDPEHKMKVVAAVELDVEKDIEDAIRAEADKLHEKFLTDKKGLRGFIRRLVFGSMLKEAQLVHYEKQVRREFEEGKRTIDASGITRFVTAFATETEDSLIHSQAGENYSAYTIKVDEEGREYVERRFKGEDGQMKSERLAEDDEMAKDTVAIRDLIREYAAGTIDESTFRTRMEELRREERGGDRAFSIDNYFEAAKAARENIEHGFSMENVMEGFAYINGEARRNVRTQEHRDNIDKVTHALMNNGVTRWIPPEILATSVGVVATIGKSAATSAAKVAGGVLLGAGVTGAAAGLKERARVTRERATAQRRKAQGGELGDSKYDRQMAETLQDMTGADVLTEGMTSALTALKNPDLSPEDRAHHLDVLRMQFARTEAAVTISDRDSVDLIQYSNGENATIEDQRLHMDIARAQARKVLLESGMSAEDIQTAVAGWENIYQNGDETQEIVGLSDKEKAFRSLRRKRAFKKAAATAGLAIVTTVGLQEARAAVDDDMYGVIDHLTAHKDNDGATQTILANMLGMEQTVDPTTIITSGVDEATASQFRGKEGYEVRDAGATTEYETTQISSAEYTGEHGVDVSRTWLDNNTSEFDGNELRAYHSDAGNFETGMFGSSTHGSETAAFEGREIVGFLTLNKGEAPIEIPGTLMPDGQVNFDAGFEALGLSGIGESGDFQWFEVADVVGQNPDGSLDINVFATASGHGFGDGLITTVTEKEVPLYDIIQTIPGLGHSGIDVPALVVPPISRRGITFGEDGGSHEGGGWQDPGYGIEFTEDGQVVRGGRPPVPGNPEGSNTNGGEGGGGDNGGEGTGGVNSEGGQTGEALPRPEIPRITIADYEKNIEISDDDLQAILIDKHHEVILDRYKGGIAEWNSMSSESRQRIVSGSEVNISENIRILINAGFITVFAPGQGERLNADDARIYREKAVEQARGRITSSEIPDIEDILIVSGGADGYRIPNEVLQKPHSEFASVEKITSADGSRSLVELVGSVDPKLAKSYVARYFNNGIISPEHAASMVKDFYKAIEAWDTFPVEARERVLKGESADEVMGEGWDYWATQFEFMGLITIDDDEEADNTDDSGSSEVPVNSENGGIVTGVNPEGDDNNVQQGDGTNNTQGGSTQGINNINNMQGSGDQNGGGGAPIVTSVGENNASGETQEDAPMKADFYRYVGLTAPLSKEDADLTIRYRGNSGDNWSGEKLAHLVRTYAYDNRINDKEIRKMYEIQMRRAFKEWEQMTEDERRRTISGQEVASADIQFLNDIGLIKIG